MAHLKPTRSEFDISDDRITHKPTEYTFVPYPGNPTAGSINKGKLRGDEADYRLHDVADLCRRLWADHLKRT